MGDVLPVPLGSQQAPFLQSVTRHGRLESIVRRKDRTRL